MSSRIKEDVKTLFEFWCEVARAEPQSKATGVIIESFPKNFRDQQILTKIPDFAFPCDFENGHAQTYSFVLTSDDSKWRFGFCRHDPKSETAMVIITYLPWHDTFLRLFKVLGELRRTKNGDFDTFLAEAYNKGVPDLGASLKLYYDGGQSSLVIQKPPQFQLPSIPENHNLNLYFNFVDSKSMISVFASMLAERRIIFTSKSLDKLSSCIQAANAFLFPMVWQHIFIPVLPMKLKEILMAPMPFLIGVPEAVLQAMIPDELGDVVVLNCDNNVFQSPFNDVQQMPYELVHQLKKSLNNSNNHLIGDRVSRIFLEILVQLMGGYRDAMKYSEVKITWDRDRFIQSRPPQYQEFLSKMLELQIFQQFIEERLEMLNTEKAISDEFEQETLRQAGRKPTKNYKQFLKTVKHKTNPTVKSAVQSMKEGSRGVKSVYKDFKSKLRDITPPKSRFHSHISNSHHDGIDGLSGHGHHHHSAPSSPVFVKRTYSSGGMSNGVVNQIAPPNPVAMSSSFTHIRQNGFYPDVNNRSGLGASPTISPASSLCSSDMNISQELQNHPLFKSPSVDRSLKPSSSLDYNHRGNPARYGALVSTPRQLLQQKQRLIKNSTAAVAAEVSPNDLKTKKVLVTDSILDTPPNMPTPPVPPRRMNGSTAMSNALNKSIATERSNNSAKYSNNNKFVPIPAPRLKKEPNKNHSPSTALLDDTTNDLISLDDSGNTSFELEDFDPLNQNAKPLPLGLHVPQTTKFPPRSPASLSTKSSILPSASSSSNIRSVHNPLYPYFTPSRLNTLPKTSSSGNREDDFELLRKYGLDQFNLTINDSLQTTGSNSKSNWTTFE